MAAKISPYASGLTAWFVSQIGSFGALFLQFLLTVSPRRCSLRTANSAADQALRFGERLGGERGVGAVRLSGQAIRGVARGVVLTALAQSLVGGSACGSPACPLRRSSPR